MKKVFWVIVFSILFCGTTVIASAQGDFFERSSNTEPTNDDGSVNPPNPDANAPIGEGVLLTAAAAAAYGAFRRKQNAKKSR